MEGQPNDHQLALKPDDADIFDYEAVAERAGLPRSLDIESRVINTNDEEQLTCSLYVSRASNCQSEQGHELSRTNLENAIRASGPLADWHVSETSCGLIAAFSRENDAEKLLQRGDLARVFQGPVQVARFSARDSRYRQAVLLRDVPWAIPLQDLTSAFAKQAIATGSIERLRQYVRVELRAWRPVTVREGTLLDQEPVSLLKVVIGLRSLTTKTCIMDVDDATEILAIHDLRGEMKVEGLPTCYNKILDADHYEIILRQGLDFFGAARFSAVPERWWRGGGGGGGISSSSSTSCGNCAPNQGPPSGDVIGSCNLAESSSYGQQGDGVLQCYRCQGFWHVAANCRHLPRCVRCGEPHSVEFCPRPRNNPICCHCSGPHHAGFRQCPVRLQLLNATPISITLSTANRSGSQYPINPTSKQNASQGQQSLKPNHQ